MPKELNARIEKAKQRLDRSLLIKNALPRAREQLSEETYRLRRLENSLEHLRQQIETLESFTLEGLLNGLLGRKEQKLDEHRKELAALQRQYETGEQSLGGFKREVSRLEEEIDGLGGVEDEYRSLCEKKKRLILASCSESASRLSELSAELEAMKAERHALGKAIQVGKNLLERLHNMTNALGRARNRIVYGGPLGLVGNVAFNAVTRQGTEVMVNRVRDGLAEFSRSMDQLNLGESETDREIARLSAAMTDFRHELSGNRKGKLTCDMSVTLPVMEQAQNAVGHLCGKLEHLNPRITALDEQQRLLIEQA